MTNCCNNTQLLYTLTASDVDCVSSNVNKYSGAKSAPFGHSLVRLVKYTCRKNAGARNSSKIPPSRSGSRSTCRQPQREG